MAHWNSSPHPISDIRDWQEAGRLELNPDFQRREVWSASARIMLMDTILRDIPMPKIFVASSIRDNRTYRIVIDGQQRIRTLLAFLRDEFALDAPFKGPEAGKTFSQLDQSTQDRILSYNIDFNEAVNPTEKEVREVYSRVNKYTVALNKQELRRADYPGDFLRLSESLSVDEQFEAIRLFTPADRRRYSDVEYISELLSAMLGGIQDGKSSLDNFYQNFSEWEQSELDKTVEEFRQVLKEIAVIFDKDLPISETRFRQKADFYTLFVTILIYVREGLTIVGKELDPLQKDLECLDYNIRPESEVQLCREYAIKCVSQANSGSSRRWRTNFMTAVLDGTYRGRFPQESTSELFYSIESDLAYDATGMCPDPVFYCPVCESEIKDTKDCLLGWEKTSTVYQMSNARWIGKACLEKANDWISLERSDNNGQSYFL